MKAYRIYSKKSITKQKLCEGLYGQAPKAATLN